MKKIAAIVLCLIMLFSVASVNAIGEVKVYAPDGRVCSVWPDDVASWQAVGWYTYPVTAVYAPDGRIEVIAKTEVEAWQAVGWYTYPVMAVYAPDGRIEVIAKTDVGAWQAVGWYTYPVITVYAPDGRSCVIAKNDLAAWKAVGWSEYKPKNPNEYLGVWTEEEYSVFTVTVYEYKNGYISFLIDGTNATGTRLAYSLVENLKLENDTANFWYKDSRGNYGKGTIRFMGDRLYLNLVDENDVSLWSVSVASGYHRKSGGLNPNLTPADYRRIFEGIS